VFESQASFSPKSKNATRLQGTLDFLDKAFSKSNSRLRNRTVVQSLVTLAARLVATGKHKGTEKKFSAFFDRFMNELSKQVQLGHNATDADYIEFQRTVSANVTSGPGTRQKILLRKLLLYDSAFAELFGPEQVAECDLAQLVRTEAAHIGDLIHHLNEAYASKHGEDLFKLTNKTSKALRSLTDLVNSYDDYGTFIDKLYFIFHEGPGQRIPGSKPTSFVDVNHLRTHLRHDVDHGKKAKVKAKFKKLGRIFEKYGNVTSPKTLAPERFPLVQAKLYQALRSDLQNLEIKIW
jgi:hypothetical protein